MKLKVLIDYTYEDGAIFSAFESMLGETVIIYENNSGKSNCEEMLPEDFWERLSGNLKVLYSLDQSELEDIKRVIKLETAELTLFDIDLSNVSQSKVTYYGMYDFKRVKICYNLDNKVMSVYDEDSNKLILSDESEEYIRNFIEGKLCSNHCPRHELHELKDCDKCICRDCINKMWDGNGHDCFHCEYCSDGDYRLSKCSKKLSYNDAFPKLYTEEI